MTTRERVIIYEISDINSIRRFRDLFNGRIIICNTLEKLKTAMVNHTETSNRLQVLVSGDLAKIYKEWLAMVN